MASKLVFWLWRLFMVVVLMYCFWLFVSAIDNHITAQMYLWGRNVGM